MKPEKTSFDLLVKLNKKLTGYINYAGNVTICITISFIKPLIYIKICGFIFAFN